MANEDLFEDRNWAGMYRLKGHTPVPVQNAREWTQTFTDEKRVAQDTLPSGVWISTVFLRMDHNWGNAVREANNEKIGPPILFETMVFKNKKNLESLDCKRYTSWEEAEAGHKRIVKEWLSKEKG